MRGATVGDQVRPQSELISIHAPLAGCDIDDLIPYANNAKFQSTHPSRGATRAIWIPHSWRKYFNPRAPCGARQRQHDALLRQPLISIHAPLAGRDSASMTHFFASPLFQSTRPVRGATLLSVLVYLIIIFQSTRPVRGATSASVRFSGNVNISIHAPRAGRDSPTPEADLDAAISIHAPRAGRDAGRDVVRPGEHISIHAPRAGRDPDRG